MTVPNDLPESLRRELAEWTRRPPSASPAEARRRVAARLRPEAVRPRTRLLAAAAAAVALAGVWLAGRADRFAAFVPAGVHEAAPAATPVVVMRLSSGTTLYVTLSSPKP